MILWGSLILSYIAGALPWSRWLMALFPHIGTPYTYSPSPSNLLRFGHFHQGLTLALIYLSLPLFVYFMVYSLRPDPELAQFAVTAFIFGHLIGLGFTQKSQESCCLILGLVIAVNPMLGFAALVAWLALLQISQRPLFSQLIVLLPLPLITYFMPNHMDATLPLTALMCLQILLHWGFIFNLKFLQEPTSAPIFTLLRDELHNSLNHE